MGRTKYILLIFILHHMKNLLPGIFASPEQCLHDPPMIFKSSKIESLINAESLITSRAYAYAFSGSTIRINAPEYLEASAEMRSFVYHNQCTTVGICGQ